MFDASFKIWWIGSENTNSKRFLKVRAVSIHLVGVYRTRELDPTFTKLEPDYYYSFTLSSISNWYGFYIWRRPVRLL